MKNKIILSLMLGIIMISLIGIASASLGTFKQNSCIDIRVLANCSTVNLTEVNGEVLNAPMSLMGGQTFNYSFCNTSSIGSYSYSWSPSCVDCSTGNCGNNFVITQNGQEQASGNVIIAFSILFIIVLFYSVYMIINMLAHVFTLDYDAMDMALTLGGYIALLGVNLLERIYLMNPVLEGWMNLFISIGLWTHVILPIMSFIFVLTVGQFIKVKLWTPQQ